MVRIFISFFVALFSLSLMGCSSKDITAIDPGRKEIKKGPGLLSGEKGCFEVSVGSARDDSQEKPADIKCDQSAKISESSNNVDNFNLDYEASR